MKKPDIDIVAFILIFGYIVMIIIAGIIATLYN
jgi:hypothetical protein